MRIDSWCVLNPLSARSLFSKTRYHSLRKYMKFIIGKKQDMIQFFDDKGQSFPATILSVSPAVVTKVKTKKKSGYGAVQIEISAKEKRISKSEKGHLKGLSALKPLKEFRLKGDTPSGFSRGDTFDVTIFKEGDTVAITGVSKGMRMAGRMGSDRVNVKNLKVLLVDPSQNALLVSGAVPGKRGTLLEIVSEK